MHMKITFQSLIIVQIRYIHTLVDRLSESHLHDSAQGKNQIKFLHSFQFDK